jgi:hypothetical protein
MRTLLLALEVLGALAFSWADASVVTIGSLLGFAPIAAALAGAMLCIVQRLPAIYQARELTKVNLINDSRVP